MRMLVKARFRAFPPKGWPACKQTLDFYSLATRVVSPGNRWASIARTLLAL